MLLARNSPQLLLKEMKMAQAQKHLTFTPTLVFVLLASFAAMAAPQSFLGIVSDSMCGAKHMLPGKTDADCTHTCSKANAKYALVANNKVYTLSGPWEDFSRLAGKRVQVTGEKNGDSIKVASITTAAK
jgi:hypothetical protein